jgi:ABC-2 type transport system permease protein
MTATSATPVGQKASILGVFVATAKSEWVKLRTVRSTVWSFLITIVITVGLAALFCAAQVARWDRRSPEQRLTFEPIGFSLNGIFLAQLAIAVLGVLVMTSEYATGQIRATFGAVPQRGVVLLAKVVVFFVVALIVGEIASFGAFFVGQAILASKQSASITDPGALRAVLGGGLYLAGIGVFALGIGAIVRRTAGAIAIVVGIVLILPILVQILPSPWNDDISKYMPSVAGQTLFHVSGVGARNQPLLSSGVGAAVFGAYVLGSVLIGWIMLRSRDA